MPTSPIRATCPNCESRLTIKDASAVGKKIKCPKCQTPFVVEAPAEEEPEEVGRDAIQARRPAPKRPTPVEGDEDEPTPRKGKKKQDDEEDEETAREDVDEDEERPAKKK